MKSLKDFFYILLFIAGIYSIDKKDKKMKPKFIDSRTILHVVAHIGITLVLIFFTSFSPYISALVASFLGLCYEGFMYAVKATPISLPDLFWNTVAAFGTAAIYSVF